MNNPLDLPALHLLRLLAQHESITTAAEAAGLSQSALSRQLQRIEAELGVPLFHRTTRRLRISEAGLALLKDTESIPSILEGALRRLRENYLDSERVIRVGVSRSLSLAHLPGLLHAQPRGDGPRIILSHPRGNAALQAVSHGKLDLAIVTLPSQLPSDLEVTHRIDDQFVVITPTSNNLPAATSRPSFAKWARQQSWLFPPQSSEVGRLLTNWFAKQNINLEPSMELDSFDLMIQLVAMGMGSAAVPRRALSSFPRKQLLQRLHPRPVLQRELVIVTSKTASNPDYLMTFIDHVLFS